MSAADGARGPRNGPKTAAAAAAVGARGRNTGMHSRAGRRSRWQRAGLAREEAHVGEEGWPGRELEALL